MQQIVIPQFVLSVPFLYGISVLGMLIHFFVKNIKGETATDIAGYFKDHLKSTIVALSATLLGLTVYLVTLKTGQAVDIMSAFGCGYVFDSFFNKWDTPTTQAQVAVKEDALQSVSSAIEVKEAAKPQG
jgi:hypothetical protein